MKYKILWIEGTEENYRRRVYIVSKTEFDSLKDYNTFVLRQTLDGERLYKSCETGKYYTIYG